MAEGLTRHFKTEHFDVFSAGTAPGTLNLKAVEVMGEFGIDISDHYSKSIDLFTDKNFDYVVTVCDDAHESCPLWAGRGKVIHHCFDDPPKLAATASCEEEVLQIYRRVRDEIRAFVESFPKGLES